MACVRKRRNRWVVDFYDQDGVRRSFNHGGFYEPKSKPSRRKKAKLPKIRFHDLRHTYASLLIDYGEHPKYIQS